MKKYDIIKDYYESKMDRGLPDYGVLGWESEDAQKLRFDILISSVCLEGKTLLDVGCGMGNLLGYMRSKGINVKYTGVDILPRMIEKAGSIYQDALFYNSDIFKDNIFSEGSFDIVYASGIFNLDLGNNKEFLANAVNIMLDLSREAVVFNLLHSDSPDKEDKYSYHHPDDIRRMIANIPEKVNNVEIKEAYLQNDFTVICTKKVD